MTSTLSFIGGGNMARSLIGGLIAKGSRPESIVVADPAQSQLDALRRDFAVGVTTDNATAARAADVVVLAVKPQEMRNVTLRLADSLPRECLIVSVAAGIPATAIKSWADGRPVVRAMPNRPALQGCGMTVLYATQDVETKARRRAEEILATVGATIWIDDESHMDVVTAVSGSGPAYFFLLIEMLADAGQSLGLAPEVARKLAIETAYGSGCMAREASESPATLREQVTSKGGTTEAALMQLEAKHVRDIFADAIAAAARRSAELAKQFGSI